MAATPQDEARVSRFPEEDENMADITLSKAVRSNLLSLQSTAAQMGKTQERLATGLKVNSALDNPTNFFTASALNSRASDLSQLLDSVSNAVQTIAAADKGLTAITKLVETAQATARQALQTAATVVDEPAAAAVVEGNAYTAGDVTASTLTINGTNITITEDMLIGDFVSAINAVSSTTGVTASNESGEIHLTGNLSMHSGAVNISGTVTGTGLTVGNNAATAETTTANPKRDELRQQYNELLSQIDQLAKDSGFNGVNLLDGDNLEVLFNEDGSSKLAVSGVGYDSAGIGLSALASGDFDDNADINNTLNDLKSAIDDLRTQASKFGANLSVVETRQDFTKNMINVLETGAANLTLADTNEEAANLLALQTRQQLSSTALSLASQADQNVLRLF
jgi:flagellin-like hook-associated protein FlgL